MPLNPAKPALARIRHISATLNCRKRSTIADLAGELEVSTRTIQRDLDFMVDQLGLPIEADRYGHFLSEPVCLCRTCGRRTRQRKVART